MPTVNVTLTDSVVSGLNLWRSQLLADGFDFSFDALVNSALSRQLANSDVYERQRREAKTALAIAKEAEESEIHDPLYPAGHFAGHRL